MRKLSFSFTRSTSYLVSRPLPFPCPRPQWSPNHPHLCLVNSFPVYAVWSSLFLWMTLTDFHVCLDSACCGFWQSSQSMHFCNSAVFSHSFLMSLMPVWSYPSWLGVFKEIGLKGNTLQLYFATLTVRSYCMFGVFSTFCVDVKCWNSSVK